MTKEEKNSFKILFDNIYQENQEATEISFKMLELVHTWDDLIDKDKERQDLDINKAFVDSFFSLQQYPLYHKAALNHHLLNVYLRWWDATQIERDKQSTINDLNKCYMLRAGIYDIFVLLAFHLYGIGWASKIGVTVRKLYGEKLETYIEEVKTCLVQQ